jgi:hypothetical protein
VRPCPPIPLWSFTTDFRNCKPQRCILCLNLRMLMKVHYCAAEGHAGMHDLQTRHANSRTNFCCGHTFLHNGHFYIMVMCTNNHATHLTTQAHAGSGVAPEGRSCGRISAIARLGIRNKYEWACTRGSPAYVRARAVNVTSALLSRRLSHMSTHTNTHTLTQHTHVHV